jgi:hypothetical protein
LLLARALGWEGLDAPIAAGFSHLLRACDEAGRIGYRRSGDFPYGPDGLSSMGALCVLLDHDRVVFPDALRRRLVDRVLRAQVPESPARRDLYREFFLSSALHVLPPGHAGRSREDLPRLLAAEQVRVGPHRGTWEAIGPWAAAGGRLCSTALAALILESPERGRRLKGWTEPGSRG